MKWLFLGDSITHGAQHTYGYDALPQVFEKYVRDDLNRNEDIVINTGVSSATLYELMENKEARYTRYKDADVVVLMFGTNDAVHANTTPESYRNNLKAMIAEIKENGSIPVLRTPNKLFTNDTRGNQLINYANIIREVSKEENCILVDHYKQWEDEAYINVSAGLANGIWNADNIHPNNLGQLKMTQKLIEEMGLWDSESTICNMDYIINMAHVDSQIIPSTTLNDGKLTVDVAKLAHDYNQSFGSVTIEATVAGITYSKTVNKTSDNPIDTIELTNIIKGANPVNVSVKATLDRANTDVTFKTVELINEADKEALEEKIEYAKTFNQNDYTASSYEKLCEAIENAEQLLKASSSQAEIDDAITLLDDTINNLVKIDDSQIDINKLHLSIAIELAKQITDNDLVNVVPVVVKEFNDSSINAQNVFANDNATQEEINNAFDRLSSAMHMLSFIKGDKTQLQKFVDSLKDLKANEYTPDTWLAFIPVVDNAKDVLANDNALVDEINETYDALIRAFLALRLKPNKDLLDQLINQANSLNANDYSKVTWQKMQNALNNAKNVLTNDNATDKDVTLAHNNLKKAIAGLQNVEPSDNTNNNTLVNNSVKTGDSTSLICSITVLALASVVIYENKKRKTNK